MNIKNNFRLLSALAMMTVALLSCKQEEIRQDMADPVVEITSHGLEGLPGESVNLTAKVSDDVGIQYILVESMDWEFSDRINFSSQNYIREYNLTESVIIPAEVKRGTTGEVTIKAVDFEGKTSGQTAVISVIAEPARLSIVQDMGFSIVLTGQVAKVQGNDVSFTDIEGGIKLPVKMTLGSNNTKLASLTIKSADFGVDETIDLTTISTEEGMKAVIDMELPLTYKDAEKHEIVFTLTDEKGNTAVYNPTVAIKSTFEGHNLKHTALFIQDKSIDMSKAVFGLPMLAERKMQESDRFTARCYAEKANTEIFFVDSRNTESQVKYGISNDGKYFIKSDSPKPIVLPEAGYYEIAINLLEGTFEVKALGKQDSKFGIMHFVYNWSDYPEMGQKDPGNTPARWTYEYDLGNGDADVAFGIGGSVWLVAAGTDTTEPEVWLLKDDKAKYPEYGGWFFDTHLKAQEFGMCEIVFDNFLMRAYAVQK